MFLKKSILSFLIASILILASLLATAIFLGPERTISWLRNVLPDASGTDRFDALVTPDKITLILLYITGLLILALSLLLVVVYRFADVQAFFRECRKQARLTVRVLASVPVALTLVVPVFAAIYFAVTLPVSQDEALTYLFFSSRNALVAYTYYPFPNNHILHSILASFTKYLPFTVLFNLRLSAILAQMAAWLFALRILTRLHDRKFAILVVSLASMVFLNLYYSYQSRGYALVNLSFIASLGCAYAICAPNPGKWLWHFLALFSAVGFAAMPSFLYPFTTIHLVLLWQIKRLTIAQIASGLGTILLTGLFYAPAIMVNGVGAFAGNAYVAPAPRHEVIAELPTFLEQLLSEMAAMHWIWVAAILLIALMHLLLLGPAKRRVEALIWMASIPVYILAHAVIPFPRTFIYTGFLAAMLLASAAFPLLRRWSLYRITALGLLLQIILLMHFKEKIEPYEERDPQLNFTASRIIDSIAAPGKTYLCSGALLGTNLLFRIKAENIENASVLFEDRPVNADTCSVYDFLIIGRHLDSTSNLQPVFNNRYYVVYQISR